MSKFFELYHLVKVTASQHTRTVLSRRALIREERAILRKWNIQALKMAKIAKTLDELRKTVCYSPDGSEAEKLAKSKLYKLMGRSYSVGDGLH